MQPPEIVKVGGALVESTPFVQRVMGLTPALATMQGPWASCLWRFGVKFRHSIHAVFRAVNVYPGTRLTEGWYLNGS